MIRGCLARDSPGLLVRSVGFLVHGRGGDSWAFGAGARLRQGGVCEPDRVGGSFVTKLMSGWVAFLM